MDLFRNWFDGLTQREQTLMTVMACVLLIFLVGAPLYLLHRSVSSMETKNHKLVDAIKKVRQRQGELIAERRRSETELRRYEQEAPALSSLLAEKAEAQGLSLTQFNEQPDKKVGGYLRKHVRAELPSIGLNPGMKFVESIVQSSYPLEIEKLEIEHFKKGQDQYNFQIGVVAFEKSSQKKKGGS